MDNSAASHTRLVSWLRLALPLVALLLLLLVFVIIERRDKSASDSNPRTHPGLMMTDVVLNGTSDDGESYRVIAATAHRALNKTGEIRLSALTAYLANTRNRLEVTAQTGEFKQQTKQLRLEGDVRLNDQQGRHGRFQSIQINLAARRAISRQKLTLQGPEGRIEAADMHLNEATRIYRFTDAQIRLNRGKAK